jgi:hypothetical protein
MNKFYLLGIALAMMTAMAATPFNVGQRTAADKISNAINAPYRDGLYLGTLTANSGAAPHISTGRWANSQDRLSFAQGYRTGYAQVSGMSSAMADAQ